MTRSPLWLGLLAAFAVVAAAIVLGNQRAVRNLYDPEDLRFCDEVIKQALRSPDSYRRLSAIGDPDPRWPIYAIAFVAANGYGAPVPGIATCEVQPAANGDLIARAVTIDGVPLDSLSLIHFESRASEIVRNAGLFD